MSERTLYRITLLVAAGKELSCPKWGKILRPSAEELAFNSQGACRTCDGTGIVRTVDRAALVPDESLTIDEGARSSVEFPHVVPG